MAKIVILGAGVMGSAFSVPCIENDHETIIVGTHLDNNFIDHINQSNNFHPVLKIKLSIYIIKHWNIEYFYIKISQKTHISFGFYDVFSQQSQERKISIHDVAEFPERIP